MPKRPAPKRRTASDRERKATTFRLDPQLHKGLVLLQGVLRRPLNRLVNEAVQGFIERRTAEVESELLEVLTRVRAYRRSDPKFENAISQFVAAEASLGAGDPVEGRPSRDRRSGKRVGPAQTLVHGLLRG